MNLSSLKRNQLLVLALIAFPIFAASFYSDIGIGTRSHLNYWPEAGQPMVYGRLAMSAQEGMFSHGGLLGGCGGRKNRQDADYQWQAWEDGTCPDYFLYKSQNGGQAMLFHLMSKIHHDWRVFTMFASITTALGLLLFLYWIGLQFGIGAFIVAAVSCLSFRGLVIFASSPCFLLGFNYLIPVVLLFAYEKGWKHIGRLTFAVMLAKNFLTGFEYFITIWGLAYLPLVFYAIRDRYARRRITRDAIHITAAITLAAGVSLFILLIQIAQVDSFAGAVQHIINRAEARTYFPTDNNLPYYFRYMNESIFAILAGYLIFDAVRIFEIPFKFLYFVILFLGATAWLLRLRRTDADRKLLGLCAATWFGGLGAFGWIIVMKGHSSTHYHTDPIVFFLSFCPLGMVFTYEMVKRGLSEYRRQLVPRRAPLALLAAVFGSLWPTP